MHRCFTIPELVQMILEHLAGYSDWPSIARMARVHKSFCEPALDTLYTDIGSIRRVLTFVPEDSWTTEGSIFRFTRPTSVSDWVVFNRHAGRIRAVNNLNEPITIAPSAMDVACLSPQSPLLPNLERPNWHDTRLHGPFIRHLLGPNLRKLRLINMTLDVFPLLPIIGTSCPSLQCLTISEQSKEESLMLGDALKDALPSMKTIKRLSCGEMSADAVIALAELPHLEQIRFLPPLKPSTAARTETYFPALQNCTLLSRPMDIHERFFHQAGLLSRLEMLECITSSCTGQQMASFFNCLRSHVGHTTLEIISIISDINTPDETHPPGFELTPISLDTLRPILSFSKLKHLYVWTTLAFSLSDEDVKIMSQAWPSLCSLSISGRDGWRSNQKITLRGLAVLSQNCPQLKDLEIVLDATQRCQLPQLNLPVNQNILRMVVGDSPIEDPVYVASYLSNILPCLRNISSWNALTTPRETLTIYEARWKQVVQFLDMLLMKQRYEDHWEQTCQQLGQTQWPEANANDALYLRLDLEIWDGTLY